MKAIFVLALAAALSSQAFALPSSAPTEPILDADDWVFYSDAPGAGYYSHMDWQIWSTVDDKLNFDGNEVRVIQNSYTGYEIQPESFDASTYKRLHLSVYSDGAPAGATSFRVKLVDFGSNGVYGGGDDTEFELQLPISVQGTWIPFTISVPYFAWNMNIDEIRQVLLTPTPIGSTFYVDNIYFSGGELPSPPPPPYQPPVQPADNAPEPTLSILDTVLFSDADGGGSHADMNWLRVYYGGIPDKIWVDNNEQKVIEDRFTVFDFTPKSLDLSTSETLEIDLWAEDDYYFKIKLVDFGGNSVYGGGDDTEREYWVHIYNVGQWNHFSIPMSAFANVMNLDDVCQIVLTPYTYYGGRVYVDNIVFKSTPTSKNLALQWLINQHDSMPNVTTDPANDAKFIRSYEGDLNNVAYTYDQAVAVIAFATNGYTERAKQILDALKYARDNADTLNYNPADPVAHETLEDWLFTGYSPDGSLYESRKALGPNMWVAMAIYQYGKVTGDHSYDAFAQGIIDYALTNFQQADGGINQGLNYDRSVLPWASVEENQDALAVMRMFGRVDAELEVFDFLDSWYIFDGAYGLYRFATGRGNYDPFMDVNPWGVLTMGPGYADCMQFVEARMLTTIGSQTGYDYDWDNDDIWWEGTSFVALTYKLLGDDAKYDFLVSQIESTQEPSGGINYSEYGTFNGYWQMAAVPGIASTGWFVLALDEFNPFAE